MANPTQEIKYTKASELKFNNLKRKFGKFKDCESLRANLKFLLKLKHDFNLFCIKVQKLQSKIDKRT